MHKLDVKCSPSGLTETDQRRSVSPSHGLILQHKTIFWDKTLAGTSAWRQGDSTARHTVRTGLISVIIEQQILGFMQTHGQLFGGLTDSPMLIPICRLYSLGKSPPSGSNYSFVWPKFRYFRRLGHACAAWNGTSVAHFILLCMTTCECMTRKMEAFGQIILCGP